MQNSWGYVLYFYFHAIRGILRKQQLALPTESQYYKIQFFLSPALALKWQQLFDADSKSNKIPFSYYWMEFEKFYLRSMDALRFNYRNILHLGHDMQFSRDPHGIRLGETVQLIIGIKDIACLNRNRAAILIEASIQDAHGNEICKSIDTIFLKELNDLDINAIKNSHYNRTDLSAFQNLSKREPELLADQVQQHSFYVPANFGARYGKVSGDRNPIHTGQWLAKFFGYPCAFLQGSATVNFLLKYFIGERNEPLKKFSIAFCKPICLGQTARVYHDGEAFEIVDNNNSLLATGMRA